MHDSPHVVALCDSLRDVSRTRIALEELLEVSRSAGATTELLDLRDYDLPALKSADGSVPDALVLGTPNYHGSYSGALKNALDYCGRDEFADTTVGLLEVAGGEFPGTALVHLRTVSRTLGAWTLPTEVAIPEAHATITAEGIQDDALAERTRRLDRELVRYAGVEDYPEAAGRGTELAADD